MAWLGVSYEGDDSDFLQSMIDKHNGWLKGDRIPRMHGSRFMIIYDSNTARELVKKIKKNLTAGKLTVYNISDIVTEIEK